MEVVRAIGLYPTFFAKGVSFAFISFALRGGFFPAPNCCVIERLH